MKIRVFLVLLLAVRFGSAASFDCARATSAVERMICADPDTSQLDQTLGALYKKARATVSDAPGLVVDQRRWVTQERNRCESAVCLVAVYRERITFLQTRSGTDESACHVGVSQMLGYWVRVRGGDFEEMAFIRDGDEQQFASWLHHSSEYAGTWTMNGCALHIASGANAALDFDYRIVKIDGRMLYLRSPDERGDVVYRRPSAR